MLGKKAKGIVPKTKPYVISLWRKDGSLNPADAIMSALGYLKFGDILLLEIQTLESETKRRYLPIEVHEAVYQVIRLASALGIIVIEAAGNGQLGFSRRNRSGVGSSKWEKSYAAEPSRFHGFRCYTGKCINQCCSPSKNGLFKLWE